MIKAQLSQLMELVWQLLPQPGQATPQPAGAGSNQVLSSPMEDQAASTSGAKVSLLPSIMAAHQRPSTRDPTRGSPATAAQPHRATFSATSEQPFISSSSGTGITCQAGGHYRCSTTSSLAFPSQSWDTSSLQGKIQHGEYLDLSELLVYNFQYRYSSLDDS